MTEGTLELANCTNTLLSEIADHTFQRLDIAQTYALAMRSSEVTDWAAVNAAIIARWTLSALEYIKNQAHSGRCFEERKKGKRDGRHNHRAKEYPRESPGEQERDELLDGHEEVNDSLRERIESMAFTIHVHEKSLDEMAATIRTRDKRIAQLTQDKAHLEALAEQRRVDLVAMRGQR